MVEGTDRDRRNAPELPRVGSGRQAGERLIEDAHYAEPELRVYDVSDPDELGGRKAVSGCQNFGTARPCGPGVSHQRDCGKHCRGRGDCADQGATRAVLQPTQSTARNRSARGHFPIASSGCLLSQVAERPRPRNPNGFRRTLSAAVLFRGGGCAAGAINESRAAKANDPGAINRTGPRFEP